MFSASQIYLNFMTVVTLRMTYVVTKIASSYL